MSAVEDHKVSFSLEVNVDEAYRNIRRLQTLLYRTLSLLRRIGLPEEVDAAIMQIQRFIALMNMLRLTLIAFETASGPLGWAMAGLSAATFLAAVDDFTLGAGP